MKGTFSSNELNIIKNGKCFLCDKRSSIFLNQKEHFKKREASISKSKLYFSKSKNNHLKKYRYIYSKKRMA